MRALLFPVLVLLVIVVGGLGLAEASRLTDNAPEEIPQLQSRLCPSCNIYQRIEPDFPVWCCEDCGAIHWFSTGIHPYIEDDEPIETDDYVEAPVETTESSDLSR